eukprot:TRINITY_DN46041_c0_g1_i1.p1 TRINITY_DN46041_c0_g1~~TRINITY_DN46041_c0_g1_i1.p1  ORF type:complete len:123 (-),score=18.64 TRINITY_DN46041_c0_g1_i1:88-456(-)
MAFFIPVLVAGGLGLNWMAAKELDEVSSIERTRRPISDFWCGLILGSILGLWTGINHGASLKQAYSTFDSIAGWVFPVVSRLAGGRKPPDMPQAPPTAQYQQGPPVQGQPGAPVVYYQVPQQ